MKTREISISDLQPGDVLLSYGHGWLSDAICFIDGGRYSHAGFYDGAKVIEATRAGIARRDIKQDLEEQQFIHVYRYKGDAGEPLDSDGFKALNTVAQNYLSAGEKFAYHQLFLLALLAIGRRAPLPLFLRKVLRTVLDNAIGELNDVLQNNKQPMICSELLYRIFYEADKQRYGLSITGVIEEKKFQRLATTPATLESAAVKEDPDAAVFELRSHEFAEMYARAKSYGGPKAANPLVKADFVTPNDLETSRNLEEIGQLSATRAVQRPRRARHLGATV